MTEKIYGNQFALESFSAMFKSGRLPHSFLIYGEKGTGKKLLADRLAAAILCENKGQHDKSGVPCGECHSCIIAGKKVHPDIIYPEKSGKLMTYTVETCRSVCADAIVAPNNGDAKIYIFADGDNIQLSAQNALLKIVEEPPEHVYFIFTAKEKGAFLPTILSRVTAIGSAVCNVDDCLKALAVMGYSDEQLKSAVGAFGGNIGMCREFIENDELKSITALTKSAVDSIINNDEYSLLKTLSDPALKDRKNSREFLELLDRTIRDGIVFRFSQSAQGIGCYPKGAERLSQVLSVKNAERIHDLIEKAAENISANVNQGLVMSSLCGEIMSS